MNLFLEVCRVCGNGDEFCSCSIRDKAAFVREETKRRDIGRIATALERLTLMVTQLVVTGSTTPVLEMIAAMSEPNPALAEEEPKLRLEAAAAPTATTTTSKEEKKCKPRSVPRKR